MILIDTHVLIWFLKDKSKLSSRSRKLIDDLRNKGEKILVSSISAWEIAMLTKKGKVKIGKKVETWIKDLEKSNIFQFVPVDNKIAVESVNLKDFKHKDPADRIIVATVKVLGCLLITSDKKLLDYSHIKTIW